MNCRTVKFLAIAVGLCFITAFATDAMAAGKKAIYGTVTSMTEAVPAAGTTPAKLATIKVKDKTTGTETSYEILDTVKVKVNGEDGKLSDIKEMDKIHFKLDDDGKITSITKGRKKPASS